MEDTGGYIQHEPNRSGKHLKTGKLGSGDVTIQEPRPDSFRPIETGEMRRKELRRYDPVESTMSIAPSILSRLTTMRLSSPATKQATGPRQDQQSAFVFLLFFPGKAKQLSL